MATIGIFYFLDGFGQMLWGSEVKMLDIGITKETSFIFEGVFEGGILVNGFDLVADLGGAALVAVLAVFFQYTRVGRALRAVADAHKSALLGCILLTPSTTTGSWSAVYLSRCGGPVRG